MNIPNKNILIVILVIALAVVSFIAFNKPDAPSIAINENSATEIPVQRGTEIIKSQDGKNEVVVSFDPTVSEIPDMWIATEFTLNKSKYGQDPVPKEKINLAGSTYFTTAYGDAGAVERDYSIPIPGKNLWLEFRYNAEYAATPEAVQKERDADFDKFLNTIRIINH
jgi:hypothetical protein